LTLAAPPLARDTVGLPAGLQAFCGEREPGWECNAVKAYVVSVANTKGVAGARRRGAKVPEPEAGRHNTHSPTRARPAEPRPVLPFPSPSPLGTVAMKAI